MQFLKFNACFCALVFVLAAPAYAQHSVLTGQVTDPFGEGLPGVHLQLLGENIYAVSGTDGAFMLKDIPAGSYTLLITSIGFEDWREVITFKNGESRRIQVRLKPAMYEGGTVVVSATRTARDVEEVSVPVLVVSKEEMRMSGNTRLSDILQEQTGLMLMENHGTGLQVQGFDPEYTLIMIDGQPLIGRAAGTLDLSRITIANVRQIEITKGPSSALWGSDALAGVVNIITEHSTKPFEMHLNTQYGSHQTLDAGASVFWTLKDWQNTAFINRNSSAGYSLYEESLSPTVPEHENYTMTYRTSLPLRHWLKLEFNGRYYTELQEKIDYTGSASNPDFLDFESYRGDYSLNPKLHINTGTPLNLSVDYLSSGYKNDYALHFQHNGSVFEEEKFQQRAQKVELFATYVWNPEHLSTGGFGYKHENLKAQRYTGRPYFDLYFGYIQHEWFPESKFNLTGGIRIDSHSEHNTQLSPKISARYEVLNWLHVRASAGRGFKAPDFRQLFLNFNNAGIGYSVFGANSAVPAISRLMDEGKIQQLLIPLNQLGAINAEHAWAYNVGFDVSTASANQRLRVNIFLNDVENLIEDIPVARLTNGQLIYSYMNLDKIYTRGVEAEWSWAPYSHTNFAVGYQYLDAQKRINETRTVQDADGNPVQKQFEFYRPMFNRPAHSGTVKLFHHNPKLDAGFSLRGTFKGRYGWGDTNGNTYVDEGEYEKGYAIWNGSVSRNFGQNLNLQFGIDNLFDFTRPQSISFLPGRTFYVKALLTIN